MSAKEYVEVYSLMTDTEKKLMADLYMTGINRDGHSWVTYGDVEKVVGQIIKGRLDGQKELLDLVQDVNPAEIAAQIESGNLHNWCIILRKEFERLLGE